MTQFVITKQGGQHVLRESRCDRPDGRCTIVSAELYGEPGAVRLMQSAGDLCLLQELTSADARALAAELLASCDAIDAALSARGAA